MAKRLFVGGLSWETRADDLRAAFVRFGDLSDVTVICHRETGRSRGFGFVTFRQGYSGTKAIGEMNETELDGRTIRVAEATQRDGVRGP